METISNAPRETLGSGIVEATKAGIFLHGITKGYLHE
jgi:hypothetical protein